MSKLWTAGAACLGVMLINRGVAFFRAALMGKEAWLEEQKHKAIVASNAATDCVKKMTDSVSKAADIES